MKRVGFEGCEMDRYTVLLADDEDTLRDNLALVLRDEGFDVVACRDGLEALRALKSQPVDAIITDLRMPGLTGMDLIARAAELAPEAGVIVITAFGEVETAVEAMKRGAKDYMCKPIIFDEVILRLKRLFAQDHLVKENKQLREQIRKSHPSAMIVGPSPLMSEVMRTIDKVAGTNANVLICGESGTGKEVIARAIHEKGLGSDRPFIPVNCGGLTETLVESELFGYRRGAFTGANKDRVGYFEAANGGTLFLDEIGNMPLRAQATVLRSIEDRTITPVGDHRSKPVDIRVMAATNRDLSVSIEAGEFREDLYFRLNVINIVVPPLRDRPEDIPVLIDHFVQKYNQTLNSDCPGFSSEAVAALSEQRWRGNVRELENVVERAMIFADGERVGLDQVSFAVGVGVPHPTDAAGTDLRASVRGFERRHILNTLERCHGNKSKAAHSLGIGLSSLYRKMEELAIDKDGAGETDGS
jgi:DNA-binding NtrC family response regulator